MRFKITKDKVVELVNDILSLITKTDYLSALMSINAQQYNLTLRFSNAIYHLQNTAVSDVLFEKALMPDLILSDLNDILAKWSETPSPQQKTDLGEVIKRVLRMLNYILSLPTKKETVKPLLPKTIVTELERLREARESVLKQIESEKKKGDKRNEQRLAELNSSLTSLNIRIESLQKDKAKIDEVSKMGQDIDTRIQMAFSELSSYTKLLEKERSTIIREYTSVCIGIGITVIFFIIWLCNFYGLVLDNKLLLPQWYSIFPYYLPVPAFVAAFWVLILQKNRASRLSNVLSDKLFQIHYLEGLLKTSNKLILDPDVSVSRLNEIINTLVDSYLFKLNNSQTIADNSDEPLLKLTDAEAILKHIEELIKTVKK